MAQQGTLIRQDERSDRADSVGTATETRDRTGRAVKGRAQVDDRLAAERRSEARNADTVAIPNQPPIPRARASVLATLSLMAGVASALIVLTGLLAGPGIAAGIVAVVLGIGGVSATARRHVAGKGLALLGLTLGLGGIVLGVLALTGMIPWLDGGTNAVQQAHDWLGGRIPWLFPTP